ncbi:MAG TPA: cytochrome P460 family protein [Pyrinomonadaceae bacterium]|jgi:hypothetical protein
MMSYRGCKLAVVTVWLLCALAFSLNQLMLSAATSRGAGNSSFVAAQVKEIAGYKNWTKVNAVPQLMPERVAAACAMVVSPRGAVIDGPGNPHRDKFFTVYVNDVGRAAMLHEKNPKFPVGSIIVKEKLTDKEGPSPELLTVMIKREKDFNSASGDWEYMVLDGAGTKIEGRGQLQNCQACHLANQKSDYIFRTYLPDELRNGLK